MTKKSSKTAFGAALYQARRALELDQSELAYMIGASRMSISRWETGSVMPRGYHTLLFEAFADAPPELLRELTRTLVGVDPGPSPATPAHPGAPSDPRAAMSQVLLEAAESLDVSPRRLRTALIDVLASIERHGLSAKGARDALAPAKKKATVGG